VTLDEHGKQVGAVGLAYAIALLERAPANWLRPALLFDLHMLLDELTNDEPNAAVNVARAHAKKLLKEMTPNELHWVSNTEGADASRRAKPLNHPRLLPSVPLPAQAEIAARRKPHPEESEMKKRNRKKPEPGDILRYRSRPRNGVEILCHNHVAHYPCMSHGANGFRYFVCRRGGGWTPCPCGWRPEGGWLGIHYASPAHVRNQYEYLKARLAALDKARSLDPWGLFPFFHKSRRAARVRGRALGIGC
jgi:hypothetical protein